MNMILTVVNGLYQDEEGASATEYAVLIIMIILVALVAVSLLGGEVRSAFEAFISLFQDQQSS